MATSKTKSNAEALRFLIIARGVISVLFGIMALVWPGLTVVVFATLVTLWLFVSGVINIVRSVMSIGQGHGWIFNVILGVLQVGIGAYLIQRPALTIATFVALLAIALVVEGVISMVVPFVDSKSTSKGEKLLTVLTGLAAFVAGVVVWRYPVSGTLAFVWVVGLFALISGPMWIALGLDTKD